MNQKLGFLCFWGIHTSLASFWVKLGYSQIKIDHIADSLLKDAVFMVGVNLRLCLLSLCYYRLSKKAKVKLSIIKYHKWASTLRITLISFGVWCFLYLVVKASIDHGLELWLWGSLWYDWCLMCFSILYTPLRNKLLCQFLGRLGNSGFQLKWSFGTHGNWKNQNPGGRFGATS